MKQFLFLFLFVLPISLRFAFSAFCDTVETESPQTERSVSEKSEVLEFTDLAVELYKKKKLFHKKSYPALRKSYCFTFEKDHKRQIDFIWGGKDEPFRKYLDEHPAVKELFLVSVNPKTDDLGAAMKLFKDIWEKYPKEFEKYPSLAVAVSLVWDNERSVHRSPVGQHQSVLPPEQVDALGNFYYYAHVENSMGERIQYLPWEFLTLLVNHTTPYEERKWALKQYIPKRTNAGKIYSDVPYDAKMLEKAGKPKLSNTNWNLENQRSLGGVCTCQADFAVRVGKSIGVPAFYCTGNGRRGAHAWVMWIEITAISARGMKASLQSEGRYFSDFYYVGGTEHPWKNQRTTDRELARELDGIGHDTLACRFSNLIVDAYEHIAAVENLKEEQQIDFLSQLIDLNPFCSWAWNRIADGIAQGTFSNKSTIKLNRLMPQLLTTYQQHPDFTWEIFKKTIEFKPWKKQRTDNFSKFCDLYEDRNRADLACKVRLEYAALLEQEGRIAEALGGLARTCMKFPQDGVFVQDVLKAMERLSRLEPDKRKNNVRAMASFYKSFLPKLDENTKKEQSGYYADCCKHGIDVFTEAGDKEAAIFYSRQLANIKNIKK